MNLQSRVRTSSQKSKNSSFFHIPLCGPPPEGAVQVWGGSTPHTHLKWSNQESSSQAFSVWVLADSRCSQVDSNDWPSLSVLDFIKRRKKAECQYSPLLPDQGCEMTSFLKLLYHHWLHGFSRTFCHSSEGRNKCKIIYPFLVSLFVFLLLSCWISSYVLDINLLSHVWFACISFLPLLGFLSILSFDPCPVCSFLVYSNLICPFFIFSASVWGIISLKPWSSPMSWCTAHRVFFS